MAWKIYIQLENGISIRVPGSWTFKSTREKVETFGSTKAQAVRIYVEKFMEGERA